MISPLDILFRAGIECVGSGPTVIFHGHTEHSLPWLVTWHARIHLGASVTTSEESRRYEGSAARAICFSWFSSKTD